MKTRYAPHKLSHKRAKLPLVPVKLYIPEELHHRLDQIAKNLDVPLDVMLTYAIMQTGTHTKPNLAIGDLPPPNADYTACLYSLVQPSLMSGVSLGDLILIGLDKGMTLNEISSAIYGLQEKNMITVTNDTVTAQYYKPPNTMNRYSNVKGVKVKGKSKHVPKEEVKSLKVKPRRT